MAHKILSVDDSRTIRMIVKKAFAPYACELFEAENGSEGLALAAREKPDLIILDITMPVMTGIEMLKKLKEEDDLKDIPVIMLTAESGKDNVTSIVKMGVRDYMVKPFKGDQLIERVKHILSLDPALATDNAGKEDPGSADISLNGNVVILTLPRKITRSASAKIEASSREKIAKLNAAGAKKAIVNTSKVMDLSMTAIQLIISLVDLFAKMAVRLVAAQRQIESLKGFKETSTLPILSSIDDAMDGF